MAERHNDFGAAERELKQAIAVSSHPALPWSALARFYAQRGRWAEMDSAIHSAMNAAARDSHAAVALYDAAGVLIMVRREPALAARLLEMYLASPKKTEEAPAFVADYRLAELKKQLGDAAGAQQARDAAYQLTTQYNPAQDFRR
jgi:Flp pilus assembly protein TadD